MFRRRKRGINESKRVYNTVLNCFDTLLFAPRLKIRGNRVTRVPAISLRKLKAEGVPQEVQKILGWMVDTHRMTMVLPREKAKTWIKEIRMTMIAMGIKHKALEKIIRKLTRAYVVLPGLMVFIAPVRKLLYPKKRGRLKLEEHHRRYFKQWPALFGLARKGEPIARLVLRCLTMLMFTDAAKYSMGGYYNETGVGWQFAFPKGILDHTTINHLEFLAILVELMRIKLDGDRSVPHILAWIDNASTVSWIRTAPSSGGFANFLFETYCDMVMTAKFTLWGRAAGW